MEKTIINNLLLIANVYRMATKQTLSAVSKKFYNNGDFFDKLKAGERSISIKRLDEMIQEFRDEWPPNAKWPRTQPVFMTQEADI